MNNVLPENRELKNTVQEVKEALNALEAKLKICGDELNAKN